MWRPVLRRKPAARLFAASLLGLLLFPFSHLAHPEWDVLVVDTAGRPVAGMTVVLSYQNWSIETEEKEKHLVTNAEGRVRFRREYRRAAILQGIAGSIRAILTSGVHAGFGREAYMDAVGKGLAGHAVTDEVGHMEVWTGEGSTRASRIVVSPARPPLEIPRLKLRRPQATRAREPTDGCRAVRARATNPTGEVAEYTYQQFNVGGSPTFVIGGGVKPSV